MRYATLNVELTDEISLRDKLGNIFDFNFDALLDAVRDENLCGYTGRGVDSRTEARPTSNARSDSLQNAK